VIFLGVKRSVIKTIKTPVILIAACAICCVSLFSFIISLHQHESLYQEFVSQDLDGVSDNLASDLVSMLANDAMDFEVATMLLHLERYDHVKFATVFDANESIISRYQGKSKASQDALSSQPLSYFLSRYQAGMTLDKQTLVMLKIIGDARLPQGYLLMVTDLAVPLAESKQKMIENIIMPIGFTILLAILSIYLLLSKLLAPLTKLAFFANDVRKTQNYKLRPEKVGLFEIAKLSKNIDAMMATLDEQMVKNVDYTRQLIEQQKAMERLANFDSLTGLPNRQFFVETLRLELCRAKREKSDVAILFFDLDGFKDVNDSFGHDIGDKLLVKIGQKVKSYIREGDVLSRLGGDEFLVLLHNNPNEYVMANIADRIISGISETIEIDGWQMNVGVSMGIARASQSNFNLSEFISNADLAMYRSKLEGKGKYTVFVESMMEDNKRKLQICNAIDKALIDNQFMLYYQPKVNRAGEVESYEALIRWIDNELGFVSPAEFIPISEKSGKISKITSWVLQQAFTALPLLQEKNHKPIKVAVNLSAIDIKNASLLDEIIDLFERTGAKPSAVEFEVTESAYLENFDVANTLFTKLKEMGASIALDDFGTGYSSLAYLTQISLNALKIDKQFIDNINLSENSNLVISAIIDMANRLQLEICAEGVETREQADFLIDKHCHLLQGYFFGKPIPLEDMVKSDKLN
jgi:diguanylate cyclase (GGDEF)-like protein